MAPQVAQVVAMAALLPAAGFIDIVCRVVALDAGGDRFGFALAR